MDPDPDEENIKDVVLDDEIERHWRMIFEDNNGGVDGTLLPNMKIGRASC